MTLSDSHTAAAEHIVLWPKTHKWRQINFIFFWFMEASLEASPYLGPATMASLFISRVKFCNKQDLLMSSLFSVFNPCKVLNKQHDYKEQVHCKVGRFPDWPESPKWVREPGGSGNLTNYTVDSWCVLCLLSEVGRWKENLLTSLIAEWYGVWQEAAQMHIKVLSRKK